MANTRPITLLTSLRKLLSLIALERIKPFMESFISKGQSGYRHHRGTLDVAWAYSWLKATAWRYQRAVYVLGIDMSKAFDTIDRCKLIQVIESNCKASDCRIIRLLLSGTTL